MRSSTLAVAVAIGVATLTAPALADDEPDGPDAEEDAMYAPVPRRSLAIGLQVHGSRIGGRSESGVGPSLELALGRHRWQYFVEGSVATSGMNEWTAPALESRVDGRLLRGMLGARWVARQFQFNSSGGLELVLLGGLGIQRFAFEGDVVDGRLTRPEITAGFGLQGRSFRRPRIAFRLDARAVFTPNSAESSLVACRGDCMMETGSSTGFVTGMALAW